MTNISPAVQAADNMVALGDNVYAYAQQYGVERDGRAAMLAHVTVPLPAHLVLDLWNLVATASRQLRTLATLNREQAERVTGLESATGAQQVELSRLRGTESDRLEALSRWTVEFAAQHGVEPSVLPVLVQSQRTHDSALWARLDGERMALEQYRLAVHSITEQIRDANGERDGLDGRGVKVVLTALRRAYRASRA